MSKPGSLGYQMMKALQGIFHPGKSRHHDKLHRRDKTSSAVSEPCVACPLMCTSSPGLSGLTGRR